MAAVLALLGIATLAGPFVFPRVTDPEVMWIVLIISFPAGIGLIGAGAVLILISVLLSPEEIRRFLEELNNAPWE